MAIRGRACEDRDERREGAKAEERRRRAAGRAQDDGAAQGARHTVRGPDRERRWKKSAGVAGGSDAVSSAAV